MINFDAVVTEEMAGLESRCMHAVTQIISIISQHY